MNQLDVCLCGGGSSQCVARMMHDAVTTRKKEISGQVIFQKPTETRLVHYNIRLAAVQSRGAKKVKKKTKQENPLNCDVMC